MKMLAYAVALAAAVSGAASASAAGFDGASIRYEAIDFLSGAGTMMEAVGGPGVEFDDRLYSTRIDLDGTAFTILTDEEVELPWSTTLRLTDLNGTLPDILDVRAVGTYEDDVNALVSFDANMISILAEGGTLSRLGPVTFNVTFAAAPVPEPASWALLIGGFGVAGGALRRRATTPRFSAA